MCLGKFATCCVLRYTKTKVFCAFYQEALGQVFRMIHHLLCVDDDAPCKVFCKFYNEILDEMFSVMFHGFLVASKTG